MSEFPPAPPKHARDCTVGNDALGCNCKPTPLHGEVERLLIGMVRTTYPADRTEYERGWNEALHAARKKVVGWRLTPDGGYVPSMTIGDSAADIAPTPDPLREAAQAVVDAWPNVWCDSGPYLDAMREAVDALRAALASKGDAG